MSTSPGNLSNRIDIILANWRLNLGRWFQSQWGTRRQALKLLRNEAFLDMERGIAKAAGDRMATNSPPWLIAPYLGDQLRASGITASDIPNLLKENRDLIIEFLITFDQDTKETIDEEYDPEEEAWQPEAEPRKEGPLGFGEGFSVSYLIYIIYLRDRSVDELIDYLKTTRVPGAAAYAADLDRRYRRVAASRGKV